MTKVTASNLRLVWAAAKDHFVHVF